ncbi:TPA: hypothetical protein QEM72_004972 [Pseudomonas putida]|uniref:hypothetical protein n=1 Tax=Pseudomonas putida TaxID=303 RepID=UPI0023637319|nr:hypothetical protein [Pseudomonas putida]MDD2077326.1 hypothetical protein [Pseudomonas putida]HDS1694368.1 hypothetical protein [Pseudomonas putida]
MKLTDKDLLSLAAKAIGGAFDAPTESITLDGGIEYTQWNPLEDDGDAFSLATDLHMMVNFAAAAAIAYYDKGLASGSISDPSPHRAIVRAAAAIGSLMP